MKKLAVVISSTLLLSSTFASANAYLGGKVGKTWLDDACKFTATGCEDDSASGGLFAGYDFNDYIALEVGYDYLGKFTGDGIADDKMTAFTIAPKVSFPITDAASLYGKFGGARVEYGNKDDNSYLGALGVAYKVTDNLVTQLEYQRLTDVNNDIVKVAADTATLGLAYKFGSNSEPTPEPVQEVMVEEVVEEVVEEPVMVTPVLKTYSAKVDSGNFALNSAELKAETQTLLSELVQFMDQYPQAVVNITGYTDSTGAAEYNQQLSERRAQAVADAVITQGVDSSRVTVSGGGESNPIASNETREGRAANRRVELEVPQFEYQE